MRYSVPLYGQRTPMSCWAVSMAMILSWAQRQSVSPESIRDATGYTVRLEAYDRLEMKTMMDHADTLFAAYGLGKPTSFRAGGWTAEIATLQGLADNGYTVDSSALNWTLMEEWKDLHIPGQAEVVPFYGWNMAQWSTINATSQYPPLTSV